MAVLIIYNMTPKLWGNEPALQSEPFFSERIKAVKCADPAFSVSFSLTLESTKDVPVKIWSGKLNLERRGNDDSAKSQIKRLSPRRSRRRAGKWGVCVVQG